MINKMIVFQMDFVEDLKCEIKLSAWEVEVPDRNKNIYPGVPLAQGRMFGGAVS